MTWQDVVLTIASISFILALLPTVFSKTDKPALITSMFTACILFLTSFVYITLHLWFASLSTCITGVLWCILAVQALREKSLSARIASTLTGL